MAKILLSLSVLFLTLSAVFGVLNTNRARTLREVANGQAESKLGSAEAELIRIQTDKAALLKTLQAHEAELAELRKRVEGTRAATESAEAEQVRLAEEKTLQTREATVAAAAAHGGAKEGNPDVLPMPGTGDLQTQLEDTRRQLDNAEREKQLLSDRIKTTQERPGAARVPVPGRRTVARSTTPGIRGSVLAVNQAYNFVVLSLGGRQGLEANTEMLVLRRGTLIGKIRVSSVEPATAIGDIVSTSLARGVQVQPGDVVIYAGPNS